MSPPISCSLRQWKALNLNVIFSPEAISCEHPLQNKHVSTLSPAASRSFSINRCVKRGLLLHDRKMIKYTIDIENATCNIPSNMQLAIQKQECE